MKGCARLLGVAVIAAICCPALGQQPAPTFEGKYYRGDGDAEYLQLLDISRRMFDPDPEFQNMPMLYTPDWNGFVEGPTWGAWWIQNSYGTTYCALPFYMEPYISFLQNAQDLWFNQMGDGQRKGAKDWVAPDGCLCDAAAPGLIYYKQGDGRIDIHDWGMEFTAAGVVLQSELLLISRDKATIEHYLPMLERSANFIETRRDTNNLFLAGPAGNLLAPSYAGCKRPDGTFDKAYLSGLSITYIAALDRLIELEKMMLQSDKVVLYTDRRDRAKAGLDQLITEEGYFIKSLDPDGTKHGVYGAPKHGYFEASPNHDAIAFRVVEHAQAELIYQKIASIPLLRRHDLICANEPGLDDMYESDKSWLWQHGTWVNGGHWSTCEARMMMAYYRLGKYEDAARSMNAILRFARQFRMDNPLVDWGNQVYQPKEPINLCYDTFGPPAAMIRGLFEYLYDADALTLIPHIPPSITHLEQRFPIRFGSKQVYLAAAGVGPIKAVRINGRDWTKFDTVSITLPYTEIPDQAHVLIAFGNALLDQLADFKVEPPALTLPDAKDAFWQGEDGSVSTAKNALPLRIGADSNGENRFKGRIGRVCIYNQALPGKIIRSIAMAKGRVPHVKGLVAHWNCDRTEEGMIPNSAEEPLPLKLRQGADIQKGALQLTGGGWAEIEDKPCFDLSQAFTIEARICPEALPEKCMRIIDKVPAGADNGYLLDWMEGNVLRVITPQGTLSQPADLPLNEWSSVAAAFDAKGELRLFVNGTRVAALPCKTPQAPGATTRIRDFYQTLSGQGFGDTYAGRHARLIMEQLQTIRKRRELQTAGKLAPLPEPSQAAADKLYVDTLCKLQQGLINALNSYETSSLPKNQTIYRLWIASQS